MRAACGWYGVQEAAMFILLTLLVGLLIGIVSGIALERWRPQVQRTVDALNDYRIGAELCDAGNLVIGAFLILSPWVFEFDTGVQSLNAVSSGIVIVALSIAAFVGFAAWEEWGNLIVGLWLVVSPSILNLNGTSRWYQVTIVIAVAPLAKNEFWFRSAAVRTRVMR
jgi:hypothetical protein